MLVRPSFAQEPVDLPVIGRIKSEAFTNSRVMDHAFYLTGGECHESPHAPRLIEGYSMEVLIGDKGDDAADFIKALIAVGAEAVIPRASTVKSNANIVCTRIGSDIWSSAS